MAMAAPQVARALMFAYPWDLADEGVEPALDAIVDVAGMDGVILAVSYHVSTYFLPHNPVRSLYYGEDGMVLFQPNAALYGGTKIEPRVSEVVMGPDYLPRLVEAIRGRGLAYTAWIVYCFNHHLARRYPESAKQDALGNRYLAQLCPANPDVRAYFVALTRDAMAQTRPDALYVESLSYLRYDYGFLNPKVLTPISPRCGALMSICFCSHCRQVAQAQGVEADRLAVDIAAYLRGQLPLVPDEPGADTAPADDEWRQAAFGEQLAAYLQARAEAATSAVEEVIATIHEGGAQVVMEIPRRASVPSNGLLPERLGRLVDCGRVGLPSSGAEHALAAHKASLHPEATLLVSTRPTQLSDGESYAHRLAACRAAGADTFAAYNYGLLRSAHLRWCGQAARAFRQAEVSSARA